jgi:hypothetical protein
MTGRRTLASSVEELDMLSQRTQARVLIVDDYQVIRTALAGFIRGDRHFGIVGQVSGVQAALARSGWPTLIWSAWTCKWATSTVYRSRTDS